MDCRSFNKRHAAFLDDTLPGVETKAMQEHLQACARCARHDADIRRSLLLLRNLPPLQVSQDFSERLRARLAVERQRHPMPVVLHARGPSVGAFLSVACGVVAVGVLSLSVASRNASERMQVVRAAAPAPVTAPVVEEQQQIVDTNVAAPAYVASMSTGMPVWPALLLAEEGSLRFATSEVRNVSLRGTPAP